VSRKRNLNADKIYSFKNYEYKANNEMKKKMKWSRSRFVIWQCVPEHIIILKKINFCFFSLNLIIIFDGFRDTNRKNWAMGEVESVTDGSECCQFLVRRKGEMVLPGRPPATHKSIGQLRTTKTTKSIINKVL
jgi:hypothetical protein